MRNKTNFLKHPLFYVGLFLVIITFCDFFTTLSLTSLFGIEKEHFYLFLHLFFVIAIFVFQEINQKAIFDKLNENVNQLAPLKKIDEINSTIQKWLTEDQSNILIFYFPYSMHPGFWYDTGTVFTNFINELKTKINQSYKSKLYFIGPDINDSPFSKSIEALKSKLNNQFVKDYIAQNIKFYNLFDFDSFEDAQKDKYINKITAEYANKLQELERHSNDKSSNFKIIKIGKNGNCFLNAYNSLPSFSFILKVNKNKAEDMIVIDTFNVVAESNLNNYINELGIDSINSNQDPQKLLTPPQIRMLNNQHTANLFLTTFLETCCNISAFDCLRNDLKNLN